MDFGKVLKRTVGAGLEREAYKQFGAAVEDFTQGALNGIFGNSDDRPASTATTLPPGAGLWAPTEYAAALVHEGTGDYRPRLKILFKVTFVLDNSVAEALSRILQRSPEELSRDLTFMVKSIDKPKIDFEYEEVNMYNFRTKVLKRITTQDLNMIFYDDAGNKVLDFINLYRMAHQPLARLAQLADGSVSSFSLENNGFAFSNSFGSPSLDTSLRGAIPGGGHNVIKQMIIHQYYVNHGATNTNFTRSWVKVNDFVFTNPRAVSLDMDDLDHEQGDQFNIATMRFDYDALYIQSGQNISAAKLAPEFPLGDIMHSNGAETSTPLGRGSEIEPSAEKNPFLEVIARQGQRAIQETVSGALNKRFGKIAGGALGGVIYKVSGGLGEAASRTLRGISFGVNQGIAIPTQSVAKSNSSASTSSAAKQTASSDNIEAFDP